MKRPLTLLIYVDLVNVVLSVIGRFSLDSLSLIIELFNLICEVCDVSREEAGEEPMAPTDETVGANPNNCGRDSVGCTAVAAPAASSESGSTCR